MGSDWPVSTPDPLQAIHVAVNRTAYGEQAEPFLPEQALDLETAFAAYTSGSAWVNHRDELDGAGVLAPGAAADLVVLDRDPFAGPPEEIGATRSCRPGSTARSCTRRWLRRRSPVTKPGDGVRRGLRVS